MGVIYKLYTTKKQIHKVLFSCSVKAGANGKSQVLVTKLSLKNEQCAVLVPRPNTLVTIPTKHNNYTA